MGQGQGPLKVHCFDALCARDLRILWIHVCSKGIGGEIEIFARISKRDFYKFDLNAMVLLCSEEFCEKHLKLLFTILEKSEYASVRSNAIIGLGDLCFRHPNLIEPWTSYLYSRYDFLMKLAKKSGTVN